MIRLKGQSSQAKHEHYPSIIIVLFLVRFVKTLKTTNQKNVPAPKLNAGLAKQPQILHFLRIRLSRHQHQSDADTAFFK